MNKAHPLISVVSPVYQAEEILEALVNTLKGNLKAETENFEIILVEDGSTDDSWGQIKKIAKDDDRVKGIRLSRNFGQHYALTAGIRQALGKYIVVLDCDLQHDPKYIPLMIRKADDGYDVIYTDVKSRKHSFFKNISARLFFIIFNWLTESGRANLTASSFTLLTRKAVEGFLKVNDYHRHYLMVVRWIGFRSETIEIEHQSRYSGKSSYTFKRLFRHAIDGIISQSDKLLKLSISVGIIYFIVSILASVLLLILYFVQGFREGWASTIVVILLSTGITLMSLGITGLYLGKIFEQSKNRPLYLIDETINL